jgi:hypothetical protein
VVTSYHSISTPKNSRLIRKWDLLRLPFSAPTSSHGGTLRWLISTAEKMNRHRGISELEKAIAARESAADGKALKASAMVRCATFGSSRAWNKQSPVDRREHNKGCFIIKTD